MDRGGWLVLPSHLGPRSTMPRVMDPRVHFFTRQKNMDFTDWIKLAATAYQSSPKHEVKTLTDLLPKVSWGNKRAPSSRQQRQSRRVTGKKRVARGNETRTTTRRKKRRTGKKKNLVARVRKLEMKDHTAIHDRRKLGRAQLSCNSGQSAYFTTELFGRANFEAAIDNLQYLNRDSTLTDDIGLKTQLSAFSAGVPIDCYCNVKVANNFGIPVNADLYYVQCTTYTQDTATLAMTEGQSEVGLASAITDYMIYPTDIPAFRRTYKILKHQKVFLRGGDIAEMSYSKKVKYNKQAQDSARFSATNGTLGHNKGDIHFLLRISGTVAHDATTHTNVGIGDGTVDIIEYSKFKVYHPSDRNYRIIEHSNFIPALTDPATVGPNVVEVTEAG